MLRAKDVIALLGGNKAVADALGLTRSGVQRWSQPIAKGGYGNVVPPRHWANVVLFAQKLGKPLTFEDMTPPNGASVASVRIRESKQPESGAPA